MSEAVANGLQRKLRLAEEGLQATRETMRTLLVTEAGQKAQIADLERELEETLVAVSEARYVRTEETFTESEIARMTGGAV